MENNIRIILLPIDDFDREEAVKIKGQSFRMEELEKYEDCTWYTLDEFTAFLNDDGFPGGEWTTYVHIIED